MLFFYINSEIDLSGGCGHDLPLQIHLQGRVTPASKYFSILFKNSFKSLSIVEQIRKVKFFMGFMNGYPSEWNCNGLKTAHLSGLVSK